MLAGPAVSITTVELLPVLPPTEAVIVTVPALPPSTLPVLETEATLVFEDVHVTGMLSAFPFVPFTVSDNCICDPTPIVSFAGWTVTDPMGIGVTERVAKPEIPCALAASRTWPVSTAVTRPF